MSEKERLNLSAIQREFDQPAFWAVSGYQECYWDVYYFYGLEKLGEEYWTYSEFEIWRFLSSFVAFIWIFGKDYKDLIDFCLGMGMNETEVTYSRLNQGFIGSVGET